MKKIVKLLVLPSLLIGVVGCSSMHTCNNKVVTQGISVTNRINTSPQIGTATETLTINGTQVPQYQTVMVNAPINANSPVTIYYNGNQPCQPGGCTVPLQLPASCYATSGNVFINGVMTYNTMQGYYVYNLNCTPYEKKMYKHKRMHHKKMS